MGLAELGMEESFLPCNNSQSLFGDETLWPVQKYDYIYIQIPDTVANPQIPLISLWKRFHDLEDRHAIRGVLRGSLSLFTVWPFSLQLDGRSHKGACLHDGWWFLYWCPACMPDTQIALCELGCMSTSARPDGAVNLLHLGNSTCLSQSRHILCLIYYVCMSL